MAFATGNFEVFEDEAPSDEDISIEAHGKLLNAVSRLYKKQRIEAPKRREPVQEISEFNLSTGVEGSNYKHTVNVHELLGELKERATHREIAKKVKFAQKKAKKLPKPVEKVEEQKITRIVGYENVKKELNKWSSIVERNKLAPQLTFPLELKEKRNTSYNFLTTFKKPTELEMEMAKVLNQSEIAKEERKGEKELSKLSIEEMIIRRNIMAKMKARESYRIAKAIRQNKIKSKKYHRILKKEKIKQELKDFEKLQKTDPEAALEKLEQIERARAEERISLRHRNTGKWARSKAIRAKYDTEARIELAEQLAKSRELTKKLKDNNSSSEDEVEEEGSENEEKRNINISKGVGNDSTENPWVSEYNQFISGYKKFSSKNNPQDMSDEDEDNVRKSVLNNKSDGEVIDGGISNSKVSISNNSESQTLNINHQDLIIDKICTAESSVKDNNEIEAAVEVVGSEDSHVPEQPEESDDSSVGLLEHDELNGSVNVLENNSKSDKQGSINEIFDEVEDALKSHASESVEKFKSKLNLEDDLDEDEKKRENEPRKFDFKQPTKLHDIDAALIEVADEGISSGLNDLRSLKEKLNVSEKEKEPQIDPNKLINVKPQKLSAELPDFDENGDDSEEEEEEKQNHLNLVEAFAEDDIVEQFRREKKEDQKSSKPKTIDLDMPGWGSWGGTGAKNRSKRKKSRLIIRFPKLPRKDEKKPTVIINDDPVPKLREQMVTELPYPFTTVSDFEASIRAPIGKQWVTERGFKKLTAPPVITKLGTIIEPMSDRMLVKANNPQIKPIKRLNESKPNVQFKNKKMK